MSTESAPLVGILMGSKSDWETMQHVPATLERFGVSHECRVLSAHRTPDQAAQYAKTAEARGLQLIIAGAGGAAHLAGVLASQTLLPVLGVPLKGWATDGLDALLSTVQMPGGIPVATFAIGKAGAVNAAIFAVRLLARYRPELAVRLREFQAEQVRQVLETELP